MAKKAPDAKAVALAGRVDEKSQELLGNVRRKLAEANAAVRKAMDDDTWERNAEARSMALRAGEDLLKRMAGEGRSGDAAVLAQVLLSFVRTVEDLHDAQCSVVEASAEVRSKAVEATFAALNGHKEVRGAIVNALDYESRRQSVANSGRNGKRESKFEAFREKIAQAQQGGKSITYEQANAICKELAENEGLVMPAINTIYSWLPPQNRKRKPD